jgi:hypothetical protein
VHALVVLPLDGVLLLLLLFSQEAIPLPLLAVL